MSDPSIMIVEDERITALEIQSRLEKKGYSVSAIIASGAEAIEHAQKERPSLALMDIHLKGDMDGVQAAETLRERFDIPVIYISAYADPKTLERAKITGPFGYVLKPIDNRELHVTIEMALYKHKIEKALRQAELRYRTVADYTYDWEYWVDPEGNFIYVSPSCERITGYQPEEFIKDPDLLMRIVHPDDHELLIGHEQKKSEIAEPSSLDFRIIDHSGNEHWIAHRCQAVYSKDGKYLGRRGSNRDITKRKKAEEEIESLAKFPSEDRSPVLRISIDGKLLYANPAAEPIIKNWNCQADQLVPDYWRKKVTEVLGSNTQKRVEQQYDDQVFSFMVVPVSEAGYANLYGRDITERKQIEKRERQHQAEVAHAARLSTIGIMASTLAHELNQPLCAILTHAEGCLTISGHENADMEKLRSKLETVAKQAERAGAIISRIRGFARKGKIQKSTTDLNEVIREVISFIRAQLERAKIPVELDLDEGVHLVLANRLQIEQVVLNLVHNSVDAMQNTPLADRKLTITTSMISENTVEVSIRDSGEGIDKENTEKILQPFFTTKPDGLGLGLSISQSIVESHSGKLYVKENSDKGVAFCLSLPAIPK